MDIRQELKDGFYKNNQGFTLVEVAIVLIIIGIIIGAVVKGKDLIRGGEQKKIYSKFMNEWRLSYMNFYDRTGKVLGDTDGNGQADTNPSSPSSAPSDAGRTGLTNGDTANSPPTYYGLSQIGLTPPVSNTGNNWKYKYTDSTGNAHDITVAYDFDATSNYNYMLISSIPNELCMALDTMIDGQADGTAGDFIGDASSGAAWGAAPATATSARWKMEF